MSKEYDNWEPSRRKLIFDWYLARLLRLLGGSMIVWELVIDSGKNPLVLLLGGMLATTKDALATGVALIKQAKAETQDLNRELDTRPRQEESSRETEM